MAEDQISRSFMVPETPQQTPQAPRGGLAPDMVGGLSKFVGNVTQGIDKVLSNPLYARAWSGMVSGRAMDPMAGPRALAELRAQTAPSLEDELNRYRLRKAQRDDDQAEREAEARARVQWSLRSGDQRNVEDALIEADPMKAAERRLAPPTAPKLDWEYDSDGRKRRAIVNPDGSMSPVPGAEWVSRSSNTALQITGYDDEGRPLLQVGGAPVTNSTRSSIEGKQLDAQGTLARLEKIRSSFRPEFQQWGTKLAQRWTQLKDSAGVGLSESERKQLSDLTKFRASAYENMSLILNQLSGAAISDAEFERLSQFLPNVGSGIFDGDSPTEIQAKIDAFESSVRASIKRYEVAKGRGTGVGAFDAPLSDFENPASEDGGAGGVAPPEGAKPHPSVPGLFILPDGSGWVP